MQRTFRIFDKVLCEQYTVTGEEEVSKLIGVAVSDLPEGKMYRCTLGEFLVTEIESAEGSIRELGRELTMYERKKLLDKALNSGARSWDSVKETFEEYLDDLDIPKTSD